MTLNREQANAAAAALAPRVQALEELLSEQVQLLPPGNSDWASTREQLDLAHGALVELLNIGAGR